MQFIPTRVQFSSSDFKQDGLCCLSLRLESSFCDSKLTGRRAYVNSTIDDSTCIES